MSTDKDNEITAQGKFNEFSPDLMMRSLHKVNFVEVWPDLISMLKIIAQGKFRGSLAQILSYVCEGAQALWVSGEWVSGCAPCEFGRASPEGEQALFVRGV
jgi:hypothetical protein